MTYGKMLRSLSELQKLLILSELVYMIDCQELDMTAECDEKWENAFRTMTIFLEKRIANICIDEKGQEFYNLEIE